MRWKVALYSALLGVAATIGGAVTTWYLLRRTEIAAFDQRLAMDAHEFFRDVENFAGGPANNRRIFKEIFVPLAMRDRFVEVSDAQGALLYRSPTLQSPFPIDGIKEFHNHKIDGRSIRLAEFTENGLTLRVGDDLKQIHQVGRDIFFAMLGAIPTVLLLILVGSRWVASKAIAPIEEIRQAAAKITVQRLDQRLPVPPTGDEIAGLIEVLNDAFERLQRSFEQSVRFSADASHHLKTPISVLRAGIEEIMSDAECSVQTQATAEGLLHRVHQLNSVADNLLLLARADAGRLELQTDEFDLRELLDGVLDDARALAEPLGLTVEAEVPESLPLKADHAFVGMITQNLIENAIKYNSPGGRVRVAARKVNGSIELTIGNTGEGIPRERALHLFERFHRVRGDERIAGSGLGLSTARELARAHGGDVSLLRSDSTWTELNVSLPQAA
ncbi:MAG: HAMP domain-containing histidine kinase [Chthoniobacterales bacterium]|nr:HAMP domain-containing histidine kinase [Chthoniobacterales bacterium]